MNEVIKILRLRTKNIRHVSRTKRRRKWGIKLMKSVGSKHDADLTKM
jgi:hypothetical protein